MIHEFRIYRLYPGKLDAFKKRFFQVALRFFEKHGIRFEGFWEIAELPEAEAQISAGGIFRPAAGAKFDGEQIAYLVIFDSVEQRDAVWASFVADEEWRLLKAESERDGALVKEEAFYLLQPRDNIDTYT